MKLRHGFVSNSSSSSFICDITGNVESGMDISYSDIGFYFCEEGHEFIESYVVNKDEFQKAISLAEDGKFDELVELVGAELAEKFKGGWGDYQSNYDIPSKYCPLCQMEHFQKEHVLRYILNKNGISYSDITSKIRTEYSNYTDFKNSIKGIKLCE